jgi:hypothetical protein
MVMELIWLVTFLEAHDRIPDTKDSGEPEYLPKKLAKTAHFLTIKTYFCC